MSRSKRLELGRSVAFESVMHYLNNACTADFLLSTFRGLSSRHATGSLHPHLPEHRFSQWYIQPPLGRALGSHGRDPISLRLPELSNSGSLPGKAGGTPTGISFFLDGYSAEHVSWFLIISKTAAACPC